MITVVIWLQKLTKRDARNYIFTQTLNVIIKSKYNASHTHSCAANNRLILVTCSLSQSMRSSMRSPMYFLLLGLTGGGPVLELPMEEVMGCILDSPVRPDSSGNKTQYV